MRRKEAYATSGTRPIVRFFAGRELPEDLCSDAGMIEKAYAGGVPMGGELPAPAASPRFLVSAVKDAGSPGHPGTDLQRLQIVKGWLDNDGNTHERVFDVAGAAATAAGVDPDTCEPTGRGHQNLCTVWSDPDYVQDQAAFYYVRVLENPSCRWSTRQCQAAGVNPFAAECPAHAAAATAELQQQGARGDIYGRCCLDPAEQPFYSPTIQERAWTSPIWINPQTVKDTL
jgi:hypothetical protein